MKTIMANIIMHLYVTDYTDHNLQGYLESPFGEGYYRIENGMQFLLIGDEIMNQNKMPQATAESRSFRKEKQENGMSPEPVSSIDLQAVKKTFYIRVATRQNNCWQGVIYTNTETGERVEKTFSSIVEITGFVEAQMNA